MSLEVIGAGFGRTGTLSLKAALELLGYTPCYHMEDVATAQKLGLNEGHLEAWHAFATAQRPMDWRRLFENYRATTDFPSCLFYGEQMEAFPNARIILTIRDPDRWAESLQALHTFYLARVKSMGGDPRSRTWSEVVDALVWSRFEVSNTSALQDEFHRHAEEVRRVVRSERLLVFDVREGWEPLCGFLGASRPKTPFPHLNERRQLAV